MLVPPLYDHPTHGSSHDGPSPLQDPQETDASIVAPAAAWGLCGQLFAAAILCGGVHSPFLMGPAVGVAGLLFLSAAIASGIAVARTARVWRKMSVLAIVAALVPWAIFCAEATFVLWRLVLVRYF